MVKPPFLLLPFSLQNPLFSIFDSPFILDAPILNTTQSSPAIAPQPAARDEPQLPTVVDNTPIASSEPEASESSSDLPNDDTPSKPVQENKGRCFKCRIKVRKDWGIIIIF